MKIGVLGAGSGIFSLNLLRDLCLTQSLYGSEVCLMDIDEKRLDASYTLCTRLARELHAELKLSKTTSREQCLTGADYVINTILMGGYRGWHDGWAIAKKYGYRRGGSLHVMHDEAFWTNFYQLRMMESVHQDILRLCPDAWYLMVSNPVFAGTTYLQRKYPQVKMVGLCHGTGQIRYIAEKMGLEFDQINCEIPGVNHFVWLNSFYYQGKDAFPLLDKWLQENSAAYFEGCPTCDFFGPKVVDLYRRYGVLPIGDTANPGGGAWGYEYHSDRTVEESWKEDPEGWFEDYFVLSAARVAEIEKAAYDDSTPVPELIDCEKSHEPMVPVIEALACGKEQRIVVNLLNDREYVPGIPRNIAVEVPAYCGSYGIRPIATKQLPAPILARAYHDRIAPVEMELAAYDGHDKQLLLDLVMMDPFTRDRKQAEGLVQEILELPYHEEMKQWYR